MLYAGSPGKKDYLKEIVEAMAGLERDKLVNIKLVLLGINKTQLITMCEVSENAINKCGHSLKIMGRVEKSEVLHYLQRTDFSVLLRSESQRYAKAGFPTKVVESLATGTPVLCNLTSDLGMYLKDGENSIIVKDCTATKFKDALRRVLDLTYEDRLKLYDNARQTAQKEFDYRCFTEEFNSFLCKN